jgi:hypothetical protein
MTQPFVVGSLEPGGILSVSWSDGSGTDTISEWLDIEGLIDPTGHFVTDQALTDFGVWLENGDQINATAAGNLVCAADLTRTDAGGVVGSISCTGEDQTYGPFSAEGTFLAEPFLDGNPEPSPSLIEFSTGTATMTVGGSATGRVDDMTFNGESRGGIFGGEEYPILTWVDETALNVFGLYTLEQHATGNLSTADGTLGVGWSVDSVDWGFDTQDFVGGIGLGHEDLGSPGTCDAIIEPTDGQGITGHLSCTDLNDPTLPVTMVVDFTAFPQFGPVS